MRVAALRPTTLEGSRTVAVLGPTNTGKTHLAVERMLGHASGMIGFPLRLLARENYDKIARLKGRGAVALITGEERIVPARPAYFVCTVEAMPLDREVAFLAIDEIQMAADRERGHVFTHRLLHARGYAETMLLGAESIKPLIRRLLGSEVEFIARPRFSQLSYTGAKKITRLPRRSAVVAFSAQEVYGIAELVRRQRGGAAVVFGALSPRTRNAQVAMYQAGEVDYLVATDAIGMGLNMDIDHVAFADLTKFDGRAPRRLTPAELAQIAGRAGRHMNNGSFGTTAEAGVIDPATVEAIENHRFPPLTALYWRNDLLDFASPAALLESLELAPPLRELMRMREADDHLALSALLRDAEIVKLVDAQPALRLLWDVCQIPDFRKVMTEAHTRLLSQVFRHLRGPGGKLPEDWVAAQVERLNLTEGDIDQLLARIAHIRTWTYVSHRADWLADAAHWQERARAVEDRLSDALHERLTQRFVDRRAAVLSRRIKDGDGLMAAVTAAGEVLVEGQFAGRLDGFNFAPDAEAREGARSVLAAANRALRVDIGHRVRRFVADGDDAFDLDARGRIAWHGQPVARLMAGDSVLAPRVEPLPADLLEPANRERVRRRLVAWLTARIERDLAPLARLREAPLAGPARGLAYELVEALGTLRRQRVAALVAALGRRERGQLASLGITIGEAAVFLRRLNDPRLMRLRGLLWALYRGVEPPVLPSTRLSFAVEPALPAGFLAACGYLVLGGVAVRADRLEQAAIAARELSRQGPFAPNAVMAAAIGCAAEQWPAILTALGYRAVAGEDGIKFVPRRPRRQGARTRRGRREERPDSGSPFADLRRLVVAG